MKKLDYTPNSSIRAALRKLFLRSRERAAVIKRDEYCCVVCGKKKSTAKGKELKVEVHHKEGIANWDKLFQSVREYLLCSPDKMETLCKNCHTHTR